MPENPDTTTTWTVRDPQSLGRAIRHFRDLQGLDQQQLADSAGLNRTYLSDLEQGKSTEQTTRLFRVLRRLGLEVVVRPSGRR
jgi:transcriptional regulator with XRE-family HTH domain